MAATKSKKTVVGGKGVKSTSKAFKSKRTSIGNSPNSRPNSKYAQRCGKKYRGQGK